MKTIRELNEKWYWRLVKAIYFIFSSFIIFIYLLSYSNYKLLENKYFEKEIGEIKRKIYLLDNKGKGLNKEEIQMLEEYRDNGYTKEQFKEALAQKRQNDFLDKSKEGIERKEIKDYLSWGYSEEAVFDKILDKYKKEKYKTLNFLEKLFLIKYEILKILLYFFIITFVLRGITYYIILGKINPPKN